MTSKKKKLKQLSIFTDYTEHPNNNKLDKLKTQFMRIMEQLESRQWHLHNIEFYTHERTHGHTQSHLLILNTHFFQLSVQRDT